MVDFGRKWPPRIAVLLAAVAPVAIVYGFAFSGQDDAISNAAAIVMAPAFAPFGLIVGGFTYAFVRPR